MIIIVISNIDLSFSRILFAKCNITMLIKIKTIITTIIRSSKHNISLKNIFFKVSILIVTSKTINDVTVPSAIISQSFVSFFVIIYIKVNKMLFN